MCKELISWRGWASSMWRRMMLRRPTLCHLRFRPMSWCRIKISWVRWILHQLINRSNFHKLKYRILTNSLILEHQLHSQTKMMNLCKRTRSPTKMNNNNYNKNSTSNSRFSRMSHKTNRCSWATNLHWRRRRRKTKPYLHQLCHRHSKVRLWALRWRVKKQKYN